MSEFLGSGCEDGIRCKQNSGFVQKHILIFAAGVNAFIHKHYLFVCMCLQLFVMLCNNLIHVVLWEQMNSEAYGFVAHSQKRRAFVTLSRYTH